MRISFISNLYGTNARGGAERIVAEEAKALGAKGHETTVIAASADAEGPEAGDAPRVVRVRPKNLYFYSGGHRHGFVKRFLWHVIDMLNVVAARKVAAALGDVQPDVVHTHNLMGLGFMVPRAIRRMGLPHVHTVHDVQLIHPSGLLPQDERGVGIGHLAARGAYAACMRALMGSPDAVIFPSRALADLHARYGFFARSETRIVPNPVSPHATVPGGGSAMLFVGQLEEHKGVMLLLDAWERLPRTGNRLEIVGTGALEPEVRERAARMQDVFVHGRLTGADLDAAYARAAYVVVPSLVIENQPTVILEAYARGIPVIAAATGGIPELVEDGLTGMLFAPGNDDELARALADAPTRLADTAAVHARIAERIARHDPARHVEALEEIYASVTKA